MESSKGEGWANAPHLTLTTSEIFLRTWVCFLEKSGEHRRAEKSSGQMPGIS